MNRILSPINVASLIILIIIVIVCDKSMRRERRLEHEHQVNELATNFDNTTPDDFVNKIKAKLPVTYNKWMKPHFTDVTLKGDTLLFTVNNGDPQIASPYNAGYLSTGAGDPYTGVVIMLSDIFGSNNIDYIFYKGYNIAIDTYAQGKPHVHFVVPSAEVRKIYRGPQYEIDHPTPLAGLPLE